MRRIACYLFVYRLWELKSPILQLLLTYRTPCERQMGSRKRR
jgi:hypothetical protein